MAGLIVDLDVGESVSFCGAVVRFIGNRGRRGRLRLEAPQDLKFEIMKPGKEQLSNK